MKESREVLNKSGFREKSLEFVDFFRENNLKSAFPVTSILSINKVPAKIDGD